ncbi:MAG TPA: recombinase, partial [Roseiflexaceae bacterium]|nr:recombinase [Roseiflexaceae bacterium]
IISMAGCGVGYSVESKYVENFPRVRRQMGKERLSYDVEDSAEGWADALRFGLQTWFDGGDVRFDLSGLRPAGAPLRIKGGRASGPEPFRTMLDFVRSRVLARQGSFLRPVDAHDMMCAVGNAAVSGGVRRTAMISLFDYEDLEMLQCKSGDFERDNSQRWNANNSAVWPDGGLTQQDFIQQFLEMVQSERGEPGIFNREAANVMKPARRAKAEFGTNPCGEINLRPWEFCNLTAAVARVDDTFESLREKVEVATIIGSIQSLATYFPGLRPMWAANCEEERLLGVDITGQMDSPIAQDAQVKRQLKEIAIEVNRQTAQSLGINASASITCVKPSGNSSQLLNCSSGL